MAVRASNSRLDVMRSHDDQPHRMHCLGAQEVERITNIDIGKTIVCVGGVVWVTQAGDPEDYVLKKGEKFVAGQPGMVLVQALDEAACWRYVN